MARNQRVRSAVRHRDVRAVVGVGRHNRPDGAWLRRMRSARGPVGSSVDKLSEKGTAIMKLTTTAQVSVDGVMQGPGGPEEDERGAFERGGWAHFDNEAGTVMGRDLPARRRVLVRPPDLRDLCRLLGSVARSG